MSIILRSKDLSLLRYLSRLSRYIETIKTNWDYRDFSRFIEIYRHFWEIFTNRQLWKVTSFHRCLLVKWIKSSNLIEIYENYSYFSIEIFGSGWWCRDKIKISRSWSSRLTFWNCWDFLDRRDWLFFGVKIESLDRDHVETNRDPQGYVNRLIILIVKFPNRPQKILT
jgi:hypothetical protein